MITANMHEAKSRLSALIKAVEEDDEVVVICRNGKEVAEIVGVAETGFGGGVVAVFEVEAAVEVVGEVV